MPSSPTDPVPIVVLGGSSAFLPSLAGALADRAADMPPLDIRLVGNEPLRTKQVARFCSLHAESRGARHRYTGVADAATASMGAAIVINQVRIGGFKGRSRDEQLALEFGYPGDETIGPAGLAAAIRCLHPVLALARAVESAAPNAWFVQVSNPMSMLLAGLLQESKLRTFGLCELPADTLTKALALLDRPDVVGQSDVGQSDVVKSDYVGLNHQGWFVRIEAGGEDLLPEIFSRIAKLEGSGFFRVAAERMRARRALPLPYLRLYEHRDSEVARMRDQEQDRGQQLAALALKLYAQYRSSSSGELPAVLQQRDMPWNAMALVPVITALLGGPRAEVYVSERNRGHLPFLPAKAIVEKRTVVTADGPRAVEPCRLPLERTHPDLVEFLSKICRFEHLATDAALGQDPTLALSALRAHPFAVPMGEARAMVGRMLDGAQEPSIGVSG